MNSRIASIRKENNLSQQEFANRLGLTKNFISLLETGNREPSDRTVSDICREFKVNEEWLLKGTGPKKPDLSREEEMSEIISRVLSQKDNSFVKQAIKTLTSLTYEEMQVLEKVVDSLAKKKD